jgi:hypothetical protein
LEVAERGHDPVAAILRVAHGPGVQHLDEAGRAGPERAVALAAGVGGGDPDHLLAADEFDHPLVQPIERLLAVEAAGPVLGPRPALQLMLAAGAGQRIVAVRRRGRVATAVAGEASRHHGDQAEQDEPCDLGVDPGRYAHLAIVSGRVSQYQRYRTSRSSMPLLRSWLQRGPLTCSGGMS